MNNSKLFIGSRQDNFLDVCEGCESVCCKGARPPLSSRRISIIKEYLVAWGLDIKKPFGKEQYSFPSETAEGYCIFFDARSKSCKIHSSKPETCVAGPITFDVNLDEESIVWYLKYEKICRLSGMLHRNKDKLEKHLMFAKKEINTLIRELSKEELIAILSIDEPETFKLDEDRLDQKVLKKLRCLP